MDDQTPVKGLTTRRQARRLQPAIVATVRERNVDVYSVFDHELKNIKSAAAQSGLYLTFFGVSLGVMISLGVVLLTVDLTSPWLFASFTVGFGASVLATAFLGIRAWQEYRETAKQFDYIEKRSPKSIESQPVSIMRP